MQRVTREWNHVISLTIYWKQDGIFEGKNNKEKVIKQDDIWTEAQHSTTASYSVRGKTSERRDTLSKTRLMLEAAYNITNIILLQQKALEKSLWRKKVQQQQKNLLRKSATKNKGKPT